MDALLLAVECQLRRPSSEPLDLTVQREQRGLLAVECQLRRFIAG